MKRIFFFVFALTAFLVLPHTVHAQTMQKGQLSLHAGAFFPQGEFGSTDQDDENSAFATTGLTVVGEYTYPVGPPGLGVLGTVSLSVNGFNENEAFNQFGQNEVDIESGYWINAPIMGGVKYVVEFSPTIDLYGLGQVGININNGPASTIKSKNLNYKIKQSFGNATSFGFTIGSGVVINNNLNISVRFQDLGKPELTLDEKIKEEGEVVEKESEDVDIPLSGIQLLIGVDL